MFLLPKANTSSKAYTDLDAQLLAHRNVVTIIVFTGRSFNWGVSKSKCACIEIIINIHVQHLQVSFRLNLLKRVNSET